MTACGDSLTLLTVVCLHVYSAVQLCVAVRCMPDSCTAASSVHQQHFMKNFLYSEGSYVFVEGRIIILTQLQLSRVHLDLYMFKPPHV